MGLINTVIVGACGKMGKEVIRGFSQCNDIKIVGAVDVSGIGCDIGDLIQARPVGIQVSGDLGELLDRLERPVVVVDFTNKDAARKNVPIALNKGASVVLGTTGLSQADLEAFDGLARKSGVGMLIAPNFSFGAVLMMKMAREISRYLNQAEIIEYHNEKKLDSPSGTAIATARGMKENIVANGSVNGVKEDGSRGADYNGIRIHSVRLKSLVAHQEVLFSGCGELLTIRHDSFSRESFIPGILMAVRKVYGWQGLKIGLESIMD